MSGGRYFLCGGSWLVCFAQLKALKSSIPAALIQEKSSISGQLVVNGLLLNEEIR